MGHGPCRLVSKDDNCVRPRHAWGLLRSGPFRRAVQEVLFAGAIVYYGERIAVMEWLPDRYRHSS
jgi:hypothetical protein